MRRPQSYRRSLKVGQQKSNMSTTLGTTGSIVLSSKASVQPRWQRSFAQFLGGERRCPPEDCGGVPGYYEFLKKIKGKNRKAALDWYGGPYDPNDIDEHQIIEGFNGIK